MQSVRQDFELMCLNALVFNKKNDEYWLEAKAFELRGQAIFSLLNRQTQMSAFGAEILEIMTELERKVNC
jgi:hypothetical protein